ncbi:unnamed protein product, partial [marine sediment metagenome]
EHLYYELKNKMENINFIENGIIFIGINHQENTLCQASFKLFDFYLKIPTITENERIIILGKISEEISPNQTFNVGRIASLTEGWEVSDIRELIKIAYLRNVAKLDDSVSDITELTEKIIDKGEFIPSYLISLNFIQNKLGTFQTSINSSIHQSINQNIKFNREVSKEEHIKIPELESLYKLYSSITYLFGPAYPLISIYLIPISFKAIASILVIPSPYPFTIIGFLTFGIDSFIFSSNPLKFFSPSGLRTSCNVSKYRAIA